MCAPDIDKILRMPEGQRDTEGFKRIGEWLGEQIAKLLKLVLRWLGWPATAEDAEDALYDFFTTRLRNVIRSFDRERNPCFYSYAIFVCLRRYCLTRGNEIRAAAARLQSNSSNDDGEDLIGSIIEANPGNDPAIQAELEQLLKLLLSCMDRLPPSQRGVIELFYFEGCSIEEIAHLFYCERIARQHGVDKAVVEAMFDNGKLRKRYDQFLERWRAEQRITPQTKNNRNPI